LLIDFYRKNQFLTVDKELFNNVVGQESDLDKDINKEEVAKRIVEVMKHLKPKYQWVLSLRFYSEMENSEIAKEMNKKVTHVNVLIHRALKSFRKIYLRKYPKSEILDLI